MTLIIVNCIWALAVTCMLIHHELRISELRHNTSKLHEASTLLVDGLQKFARGESADG